MFKGDIYLTMYIVFGVIAGVAFSKADTTYGGVVPLLIGLGVAFLGYLAVSRAHPLIKVLVLAALVAAGTWYYFHLFSGYGDAAKVI